MNIKLIKDYYGLDSVVIETLNYISENIYESFNTDDDTKWMIISKKNEEIKKHLLEIDATSRKRTILKILLSEQISSLFEMMECIYTGIIKGTHLLMRNIYECVIHIETYVNYHHNDTIFKNWVNGEIDARWRHKNELKSLRKVRKDKSSTKIEKETYGTLCDFAHPTIDSNLKALSKDRSLGVYKIDKNWLYLSVLMVIDGCRFVYKFCAEKEDVMSKLNQFSNGIGKLMAEYCYREKQMKDKSESVR